MVYKDRVMYKDREIYMHTRCHYVNVKRTFYLLRVLAKSFVQVKSTCQIQVKFVLVPQVPIHQCSVNAGGVSITRTRIIVSLFIIFILQFYIINTLFTNFFCCYFLKYINNTSAGWDVYKAGSGVCLSLSWSMINEVINHVIRWSCCSERLYIKKYTFGGLRHQTGGLCFCVMEEALTGFWDELLSPKLNAWVDDINQSLPILVRHYH